MRTPGRLPLSTILPTVLATLLATLLPMLLLGCASTPSAQPRSVPKSVQPEFLRAPGAAADLPFSEAVRVGDTLYLSGQIGLASSPEPSSW